MKRREIVEDDGNEYDFDERIKCAMWVGT